MRNRLETVYERFDPMVPATSTQRVDRMHTPLQELVKRFRLRLVDPPRMLLAGTTGTGKTTELLGFARALEGPDRRVLFVDLVAVYQAIGDTDALQRIQPWEVVFHVGVFAALELPTEQREAHAQALLDAFGSLMRTPEGAPPPAIDAGQLLAGAAEVFAVRAGLASGSPVPVVAAKAVGGAAKALKWALPLGTGGAVPDQDRRVRAMLDASNAVLGALQRVRGTIVVIDGLDRLFGRERALEVFVHSSLFGRLAAPLLVTAPFAFRHDKAFAQVEGFQAKFLRNEPVLDHADPTRPGPGVAFFRDLFRRRTEELGVLVSDADLETLAMASGGRARDFVKLVREAAVEALMDGADTIGALHVERARTNHRHLLESELHDGDRAVLAHVLQTLALPDSPLVPELLITQRILPYPNESEWFYPHPLLIPMLERSGSSA